MKLFSPFHVLLFISLSILPHDSVAKKRYKGDTSLFYICPVAADAVYY
jgi:hypothetical protein